MTEFLDPKLFGLTARTVLEKIDERTIALIVDRKSRIIMSDGRKILAKIQAIQEVEKDMKLVFKSSAPICSKTMDFLREHKVEVLMASRKVRSTVS